MILAKVASLFFSEFEVACLTFGRGHLAPGRWRLALFQWRYHQYIIPELNLDSGFPAVILKIFGDFIVSCNGHKLCFQRLAKNPGMLRPVDPCQRPAPQWPVNMHIACRQHLGPSLD